MVVYSDDFQTLNSLGNNTLEVSWTQASSALRAKNFSNRIFNTLNYVERTKPDRILANLSCLTYSGAPYLNESFSGFIIKSLKKSNVQKLALVQSKDSITRILTEEILTNVNQNIGFEYKYFDSEEDAYNWLYL
ncbi:MAG: hypothetical protein KAI79_17235 [Bacteroidales bacterium]|nr:hypothetical protein [Bacteroidales bacterium]